MQKETIEEYKEYFRVKLEDELETEFGKDWLRVLGWKYDRDWFLNRYFGRSACCFIIKNHPHESKVIIDSDHGDIEFDIRFFKRIEGEEDRHLDLKIINRAKEKRFILHNRFKTKKEFIREFGQTWKTDLNLTGLKDVYGKLLSELDISELKVYDFFDFHVTGILTHNGKKYDITDKYVTNVDRVIYTNYKGDEVQFNGFNPYLASKYRK